MLQKASDSDAVFCVKNEKNLTSGKPTRQISGSLPEMRHLFLVTSESFLAFIPPHVKPN